MYNRTLGGSVCTSISFVHGFRPTRCLSERGLVKVQALVSCVTYLRRVDSVSGVRARVQWQVVRIPAEG